MYTTQRKAPLYFQQRQKRFVRRKSQKFQKSIQSKRQIDQSANSNHYIKTPTSRRLIPTIDNNDFFKKLATNYLKQTQQQIQPLKKSNISRDNYIAKLQTIQAQMELKNQQYDIIKTQHQRYKKYLDQQKQKRRKIQQQKKDLNKQFIQLKKQYQKLEIQNKVLIKQKQLSLKQIQFLEKINFDQKTRTLQSYREGYLQSELERLRKQMKKSKTERQKKLQQQIAALNQEKYTLESHFKALKVANQCLLKQMTIHTEDVRQFILSSDQYIKLQKKYTKFLEQFKQLRTQYWALKSQANARNNQSSLLSITYSSND